MGGGRSWGNAFLFKFELHNTSRRGRHCPIDHYCHLTIMLGTPNLLIDGKKTAGDTNDPNYTQRRKSSFPIIRANRFLPEQLVLRRPHDHAGLRHVIEERFPRHLESRHARCASTHTLRYVMTREGCNVCIKMQQSVELHLLQFVFQVTIPPFFYDT